MSSQINLHKNHPISGVASSATPNERYLVMLNGEAQIWDANRYNKNAQDLYADYPDDALAFKLDDGGGDLKAVLRQQLSAMEGIKDRYAASISGAQSYKELLSIPGLAESQYLVTLGNEQQVWDAGRLRLNGDKLMEDHPETKIAQLSYKDYWYDKALADEESLKTMQGELEALNQELGGKQRWSPEYNAIEAQISDKRGQMAQTQSGYDANPRVIEAKEKYEAEYAAAMEEYQKKYLPNLRKKINAWKEEEVDEEDNMLANIGEFLSAAVDPMDRGVIARGAAEAGYDTGDAMKVKEKVEQFDTGLAFLDKAERIRKEHSSFTQGFSNWAQGVAESKMTQSDLDAYTEIYTILQRLEKELGHLNNISEETLTQHLSKSEQALILGFFEYNAAQEEVQDSTRWEYKAGQIAGEAIPFILEFIATGGLTKAATKGATKGLSKALASWIKGATKGTFRRTARKVVAKGVRGAARGLTQAAMITPLRPTAYTNVTKAMTQIGEDGKLKDSASDIAIAVADEYIETLSELSGGAISKLIGTPAKWLGGKVLGKETFEKWSTALLDNNVTKFLARGQFHGMPVEIAEEYFGNALREIYDPKALDHMHEDGNFLSMVIGFAPMTLLGAGVGYGQYAYAKNSVNKGAAKLRETLLANGYEDSQIEHLLNFEKELTPQSLAKELDPVLKAMALKGASKESQQAVVDYAIAVSRYKAMKGAVNAQETQLRKDKLAELEGTWGKFYQTKNEGTKWQEQNVTTAQLYDGRSVFLTSEKNEMGEYAAIDMETGETMPVSESDIAIIEDKEGNAAEVMNTQSLDSYLTELIMSERKTDEQMRMQQEEASQIAALQQRLAEEGKLNIGTSDAPVYIAYLPEQSNDGMAHFTQEDGSESILTWNQVGDYLGQPIRVLTDEQMHEAEAAAMATEEAQRRAEMAQTDEQMDKTDETVDEALQAEEKAAPVHIPMNPDGTVNTDLFWDQNPEEWVKWNDQQRQDNGVDSMAQIAAGLQTAEAKLAEASKLPFATPTQREAKDKEMGFWQDKINRYNALLEQYQLAAAAQEAQMARVYAAERLEAAEAALADKMTQAPKRSDYRFTPQYMQAKQKFDAEVASLQEEVTRWQNELAQYGEAPVQQEEAVPVEEMSVVDEQQPEKDAPSAEELAAQLDAALASGESREDEAVVALMQSYADAISAGVPAKVVTRRNVLQTLKDAGVSETKMAEVKDALRRIQYIVNGFEANGVAYILADSVIISDNLRSTYVHERQHIMTAVSGIDAALMTMTSREELQEAIAKLTNSNFYDGKGHLVLADELVSMAMERAYKGENLDEVFEQIGFKNENAINFIKDIDNAQRNDSGLSLARVAEIGGNAAEGGSRQDGRTEVAGSTEVGEQGPRSVGRGGETAGDNTSGRGVGFSVSPNEGVAEMIENENGEAIAETNGGGDVRFSVLTYEQGGRDYLVNWLRKSKYMSKEERDFIIATLDQQYELAKRLGEEFPAFGAWSSAEVNVDKDGNPVMSVIKANGDYSMNLDFSLICKKRRPLNALLDVMIADRMLDMRSLNEAEIAKINKVIQRHGFEVACALCFVDSKRYRVVKVATDFADLYNELVNSLIPEGSGIEAVESNYAGYEYINERNAEKTGRRLETVPDAELNWAKVDEILEGVKTPKSVEEKVAWMLRNNPSQRKLVNATDFVTNLGFESVKKNNPELLKVYNAKKGTGGPKASFGDVQYLNDILKSRSFTPAKAYSVGGVRVQSFSDYMGHMFFDYMQMMAELSAKGLPAHAYTKEEAFARIFGMTGMKINMSLVPAVADDGVAPGLDAEGNYVWAVPYTDEFGNEIQGQTFPPDVAFELQRDPRYSKNVGIIAVGVSDEHILKMLNDDQIHFVIPYHKSSLNPEVAKLTKIDKYADYTNVQNTRLGWEYANLDKDQKKAELKKRAFDFYKSLAKTKDPKATAAEYLEHCRQNGLIPKYDQFSGHENYYKLLVDFNTYDFNTGEYAPQGPVTMTFPEELESLVKASVASNEELESDLKDKVGKMAEDVKAELGETRMSVVSPQMDADYLAAVERGDMETAQRMVLEAAKLAMPNTKVVDENGNPKVVYHGTGSQFYTFRETSDSNELGAGYYFSDSYEMAERYATDETLADNRFRAEALAFDIFTDEMGHSEEDYDDNEFIDDYNESYTQAVERLFGNGHVKSVFLNLENPRIMSRNSESFDPTYRHGYNHYNEGVMAKRFNDGIIDEMFEERHEGLTGTQYVAFNSSQIKSADPVTYDDNGNVIPLSERFNEDNPDIRFSTVMHGTAAEFDKFDHQHMGEGEGAQAYGWGTYLTEVEGIARTYAVKMRNKLESDRHRENRTINSLARDLLAHNTKQEALDYLYQLLGKSWSDKKRVRKQIKIIESGKFLPEGKYNAFLYTVEIPDDAPYIIYENAIEDQQEVYDAIVKGLENEGWEKVTMSHHTYVKQGNRIVINIKARGADLYAELSAAMGSDKEASEFLARNGVVGISYPAQFGSGGRADAARNYVIFNEEDAKIKGNIRFSIANENQAIFVSNAAKAVEGIKQEKATPAQWLAMLEKNGGLKAAEDKWMGLSDWLKESGKKTLTKAEVLEFVNEHAIKIEETHYDAYAEEKVADAHAEMERILQDKFNAYREEYYEQNEDEDLYGNPANDYAIERLREELGDEFPYAIEVTGAGDVYLTFPYEEDEDMRKWSDKLGVEYNPMMPIENIRLGYTTYGLTNKREIALTVPTIESWNESDEVHFGDAGDGRAVAWIRFGEAEAPTAEYKLLLDEMDRLKEVARELYEEFGGRSNELAEVEARQEELRLEMRSYKNAGHKVLVIDEIQSKRHQEGREKGYRTSREDVAKATEAFQSFNRAMKEKYGENVFPSKWSEEDQAEFDRLRDEHARVSKSYNKGIPDAPFEKNWHELAMKRMLRYAAENGYDYIAWTKGEQQAERYNLGKVYNEIEREDNPNIVGRTFSFSGGNYDKVTVNEDGVVVDSSIEEAKGKPLSDLVGKDLAVKMMSIENYDTIDGEDLRIGGEGMRGFYDKMLPAFMNKYGKKWGVKVEDINLPNLENGLTMHSVPVTEEMKASVMEGQTMFSVVNDKSAAKAIPNIAFGSDIRFSLSKNNRQTISSWMNKRPDINDATKAAVLDYLDGFNDATLQLSMGKWFVQNSIKLPEDTEKCMQAVASAKKAKVDPMKFASPMEIINQYGVIIPKVKPINPDNVSTLTKVKELKNGLVVYDVEESEESRKNMRDIINTHYGKNCSPWCLLQGDEEGNLTDKSEEYWGHYSAYPKQVVFKDGKLLAFSANETARRVWWDRMDQSYEGIPVTEKLPNDELGRSRVVEHDAKSGKVVNRNDIKKTVTRDGVRQEWTWASEKKDDIKAYFEEDVASATPLEGFRLTKSLFGKKKVQTFIKDDVWMDFDEGGNLHAYSSPEIAFADDVRMYGTTDVYIDDYGILMQRGKAKYAWRNEVSLNTPEELQEIAPIIEKASQMMKDIRKTAQADALAGVQDMIGGMRFSVSINPAVRAEMDIIKATAMVNGNYMKAPNGQPTKLTEDQWALVRTKNFISWFGDWLNDPENASKVVDENGEPMVVYHGTAGSINKFENQQRSPGFWFVDREDVANGYAESASAEFEKGKNVVPVFLNMRNPRIEDARGEYPAEFALKSFVENDNGVYEVFDTYEEAEAYQKQNVPDGWIGAAEVGDQNDLVERAKEFGYDGVIMKNMHDQAAYAETRVKGPQTNYVALNPNQIKSATETTGLFSENEDIRFSAIVPHESSMDEIDQMFASLNRDPFVRDLYAKVSDLAHKMNLKIKFVEPWSEAGGANILDKVKYNVDYFNSNDYAQTKAGVLLHELIHSVTVYAVAAKNSSVLTQEMKDAVKQMEAIYDEIKDDPAFDGTYGAESVKEMVSELSNPRFRQKLRAKNLLQRIIDAIKQLLGIDKGTNALDNLEGTLEYMIENFDQNAFDAVLKANEQSDYYTRFSVRTKPAPKEVKRAYKLFNVDGEGKPHALFIDGANALDEKVWYDADSPLIKDLENLESGYTYYVDKDGNAERKTYKNKKQSPSKEELADAAAKGGRYIYVGTYANGEKSYYNWGVNGGKNGGSVSQFAMRPGWHLTDSPSARHIGAGRNPEAKQEAMYRKPNQRWFEVEYAADVDYNEEAKANPTGDIQTHIPEDGYYSFKTNTAANDVNQNWIISGAIRIVKPLTREEVSKLNEENGVPDDLDYENGTMFSVSERSVDEIVNDGVQKVSEEGKKAKASLKQRMDDIDSKLYYVMRMVAAAQKNYDKKTVDIMTNLAKELMRDGALSDPTRGEINRLLSAIKNATGKADLTAAATTLMDVMVSNQLRHAKNTFAQMLKIKASKVSASGVEAQGTLDVVGQRLITTVKESVGLTLEQIDDRIAIAKERMDEDSETTRKNAEIDLAALEIARKYVEGVKASEAEEADLRHELELAIEDKEAGKMTAEGLREFRKATEDAIRENRLQRTAAYRNLLGEMAKMIAESVIRAGDFRNAEKDRIDRIHHFANSDLEGLPAEAHQMKDSRFWNSNIVRFFLKPLSSFEQWLKKLGGKNAEGKGYLYNHFIPGWVEATNKEFSGTMEAYSQLDAKAREVFGGKVKRWSDLFAVEKKKPTMTVKIWDDGKMKEYELSQGNLLYIYMVNKMTDGKMKLRKMGITEEDVRNIYNNLDPRFIELAEWIQNDFLPSLRDKYNAVHERMFGAPMAAIDNYFPIRVLANARTRDVEVGTPEGNSNPSTITGNIIKRTKNSLALDVLGSDAFDVVLEHIQQMEHWAAFAEWNRDLNTLLSYKKFRNRVQNMSGIYGAGTKAWEEFRASAEIAAGVYRPKTSAMDKILSKVVRGLTAGKIGFRFWTAMKQVLSAPAFAPYTSPATMLKNMAMPKASWDWAMENLEGFEKRWKSRDMGNVRLKKNAAGIERWTDDWMDTMTKIGMTPNAFVDAVTCAIGAKSVYETAYAKYVDSGYSAADADKKAKVDATVAFNTTQQSGEGAFLSSLQADRDLAAYMTTTYRNANFGMGREFFDAARNLKHRVTPGYKAESIAFMTKQMMRDGLSEANAKRAAERIYRNGLFKDSARVVTFGFVMQFLWNMGNSIIYQLFGDDDEEKQKMIEDAAFRAIFGPIENLTLGNVILDGVMVAKEGDMTKFNPSLSPAGQDLTRLIETLSSDPVAGVSDLVNILCQCMIGTNPQVAADAALAIYDACDGDMETSKEVGVALLRILQAPQSQVDKLIEDEIDFTKDKGLDLTIEEFARNYAEYKRKKNAPYTFFLYSDEEERKKEDRYIKRFTKRAEELKRTRGNEEAKAWYNYVDNEYKQVDETVNELRGNIKKAAKRGDSVGAYEFAEKLNELTQTPEFKRYAERVGRVKLYEKLKQNMKDIPLSRDEFEEQMLEIRRQLVEEMQSAE